MSPIRLACILLLASLAGCAQRTLTITSTPEGALVYLNQEEVGRTPMTFDFTWYSDYDVTLRKEGYETLKTHRKLKAPVYNWVPFDLISELIGLKDRQSWHFAMKPQPTDPTNPAVLIARAQQLKAELKSSKYTRPPTTLPTTMPAQ